jgi:hypothetical protein
MESKSGHRRWPNRVIVSKPASVVLSFWTAQAAMIAANAVEYEIEGRLADAVRAWQTAVSLTPADGLTRRYCTERIAICSGSDPTVQSLFQGGHT